MAVDLNRIVKVHLKIRDARQALSRQFDLEDGELKAKQERLETEMLKFLLDNKTDSFKTTSGTVFKQEEIQPSVPDWDALFTWIKNEDAFDALERRVKKKFIKDYMEEHKGAVPPGVSVLRSVVARVRRS